MEQSHHITMAVQSYNMLNRLELRLCWTRSQ